MTWAFGDESLANAGAGSATISVTLASTPNAGDCLVAYVTNVGDHVTGITGGGGTWALLPSASSSAHIVDEIWACPNVDGSSSPVVVTFASATYARTVNLVRFSGGMAAPTDQGTPANGSGTTPTTG